VLFRSAVEKQLLAVKDGTWLSDANQDAGRGHEASRQQGHKEI
jgi:hypothetical protein